MQSGDEKHPIEALVVPELRHLYWHLCAEMICFEVIRLPYFVIFKGKFVLPLPEIYLRFLDCHRLPQTLKIFLLSIIGNYGTM